MDLPCFARQRTLTTIGAQNSAPCSPCIYQRWSACQCNEKCGFPFRLINFSRSTKIMEGTRNRGKRLFLNQFSGDYLSAEANNRAYSSRNQSRNFMKSLPANDLTSESSRFWPQDPGSEWTPRNIFSLLLEIESRLRAEKRGDSLLEIVPRKPARRKIV